MISPLSDCVTWQNSQPWGAAASRGRALGASEFIAP